ncbi:hypothetical protein RYH80_03115 [Halobaculum sp. MBLA0147]|uniref:hypothetical protein n=1 Tax=Halobaculum sp. MBLA0147 TaxID=3079934 RepID=UPI0035259EDB
MAENEPVNHARRYARYVVERERGYEAIRWNFHPDKHLAAALAIVSLDTDTVHEFFGDLYQQVLSHYSDTEPAVELPDEVRPQHFNYKQDVYLGLQPDVMDELTSSIAEAHVASDQIGADTSVEERLTMLLGHVEESSLPDLSDLTITATSGVHVHWDDISGSYHTEYNGRLDIVRDPDAQLDILPFAPESVEAFRDQLARNLLCVARDCYVEMGVTPPEPFRIQGLGRHRPATLYEQFDFYQRYHDPDATIDWLAPEPEEHRRERDDDFYY